MDDTSHDLITHHCLAPPDTPPSQHLGCIQLTSGSAHVGEGGSGEDCGRREVKEAGWVLW